ncbi:ribonuclease H-like domain-containing protein [Podospora appendiculata]|uniref:Ribonuclease H-like domain-containing protein n=1 Tax=Podospora appendiculata TaxID=314037 RepID=A0AAE0XBT2_9PEZI|nr:ribonuclease H-like domain-containing protein [Podospora appendiculata]
MASFGLSGSQRTGKAPAAVPITPTAEYLEHLHGLVLSRDQQKSAGYVMEQMTQQELEKKRRCGRCGLRYKSSHQIWAARSWRHNRAQHTGEQAKSMEADAVENVNPAGETNQAQPRDLPCKFHPGALDYRKFWSCCGTPAYRPGCKGEEEHEVQTYARGELERRWHFEPTPLPCLISDPRCAVAIDCEMGTAYDGESELIRVTMVDYFSGAVLVDKLVCPDVKMAHYNTRYSGVTTGQMEAAKRARACIFGTRNAKVELWRFVGPETIVVGHSAQNDLAALRWIHSRVVDTYLIESALRMELDKLREGKEAENSSVVDGVVPDTKEKERRPVKRRPEDGLSLKALTKRKLGRAIQVGKMGHDSLEDAVAARDLIHFHVSKLMALTDSD